MTSYGSYFSASTVDAKDVHSSGTIYWQNFSPALSGDGGIPTLSAVLEAGDDANEQPLLNVGKITLNQNASDPTVDATISNCAGLDFGSQASSTITGSTAANDKTVCSNLDLRDASNLFPSSIDDDNLSDVLTRGNDADGLQITNVGLFDCSNAQVGTAGTPGQLSVVGTLNASSGNIPYINVNSTTGQPNAKLDFTGLAEGGQTTEIEGDDSTTGGVPNRTKCSYLDLTDSTNLHPPPTEERYEWGSVWTNAKTIFPAPPYADGSTTQIPTIDLVRFDFNTIDLARTPQWRFFAPQSDSDRQIDPDDHMELHEGQYIGNRGGANSTAWPFAFYATTASTTVASHASQVVEFHFPATFYGYGRIYMCLAVQAPPYSSDPQIHQQTFRLVMEHEGSALATNPRLNGPIQMKWYCKDMFPTDGTQWRVYPMCRVDDARHYGRLQINIGNGQPLDGNNPGDPPEFTPDNTNAQNGQLILRGYPLPATFSEFANPS